MLLWRGLEKTEIAFGKIKQTCHCVFTTLHAIALVLCRNSAPPGPGPAIIGIGICRDLELSQNQIQMQPNPHPPPFSHFSVPYSSSSLYSNPLFFFLVSTYECTFQTQLILYFHPTLIASILYFIHSNHLFVNLKFDTWFSYTVSVFFIDYCLCCGTGRQEILLNHAILLSRWFDLSLFLTLPSSL